MIASLAGERVTSARSTIPGWGCWYAEASIDGEHALSGAVELVMADLTLKGTILSGGPQKGRSSFIIVGGKGKWGKTIPRKSYANDAGVKVSTVLGDAAREAGETLELSSTDRVGPAFVRAEGPASRVLEQIAPATWYVGEDGITRLGKRPRKPFNGNAPRVSPVDLARRTVTLASEKIAALVPGAVVDGIEAVDVLHEIGPSGLRTTIYGEQSFGGSRELAALRKLLEQLDPNRKFRGVTEYRVVTQEGERLNLQPVRVSAGMPDLQRVSVRPGISGAKAKVMLGSRVIVGFVDADPSRPYVAQFEDADGNGFTPLLLEINASTFVKLADGVRPMAATGDLAAGLFPIVGTTRVMG